MIMDHLYLVPLPHKISEIVIVLTSSVAICTVSERVFLRVLGSERLFRGARAG
jgi:hypothetical protein